MNSGIENSIPGDASYKNLLAFLQVLEQILWTLVDIAPVPHRYLLVIHFAVVTHVERYELGTIIVDYFCIGSYIADNLNTYHVIVV